MDEGCLKLQTHRKLGLSLPGTDARVQTVRLRHCQTRFLAFQGLPDMQDELLYTHCVCVHVHEQDIKERGEIKKEQIKQRKKSLTRGLVNRPSS